MPQRMRFLSGTSRVLLTWPATSISVGMAYHAKSYSETATADPPPWDAPFSGWTPWATGRASDWTRVSRSRHRRPNRLKIMFYKIVLQPGHRNQAILFLRSGGVG